MKIIKTCCALKVELFFRLNGINPDHLYKAWQAIIKGPPFSTNPSSSCNLLDGFQVPPSRPASLLGTEMTTSGPNFLINYMSMKQNNDLFSRFFRGSLAEKMMREDV